LEFNFSLRSSTNGDEIGTFFGGYGRGVADFWLKFDVLALG